MSNKVEGWLLRLHGWMALNFLKGWCHSLNIACLLNSKLFEEEVEAWKSAQWRQNQNPKPQQILPLIFFGKQWSILFLSKKWLFSPTPSFYFIIFSWKSCLHYQPVLSLQFLRSCQHGTWKEILFKSETLQWADSASCLWMDWNFIWTIQLCSYDHWKLRVGFFLFVL